MLNLDALATMLSSLAGSSPTTSYIESATGIAAGGRTGFTSFVTGILFLLSMLFIPLIMIIPSYATASALIIVGIIMIKQIARIDLQNYEESIPAILTIIMMPLSFSISVGMSVGFISWGLMKLLLGKHREVNWVMLIVIIFSILNLIVR